MTRIVYIGNFEPPYSTENDVAHAFETIGVDVHRVQESDWIHGNADVPDPDPDTAMVLWTRTWPVNTERATAQLAPYAGHAPVVGFHLDVWWGLARQRDVYTDPYFQMVDTLVTADGGSDRLWIGAGVNHMWRPPAVSDRNTMTGTNRPTKWPTGIVFVGQTQPPYHPEWSHRGDMLTAMQRRYGRQFTRLPHNNQAIRGDDLADVYATAAVVIGDSCFAGIRPRYWSDRIPETLARGGVLMHPDTDWGGMYMPETHLFTWPIGNWDAMFATVDRIMDDPDMARRVADAGRAWTLEHHTYRNRAEWMLEHVTE